LKNDVGGLAGVSMTNAGKLPESSAELYGYPGRNYHVRYKNFGVLTPYRWTVDIENGSR